MSRAKGCITFFVIFFIIVACSVTALTIANSNCNNAEGVPDGMSEACDYLSNPTLQGLLSSTQKVGSFLLIVLFGFLCLHPLVALVSSYDVLKQSGDTKWYLIIWLIPFVGSIIWWAKGRQLANSVDGFDSWNG